MTAIRLTFLETNPTRHQRKAAQYCRYHDWKRHSRESLPRLQPRQVIVVFKKRCKRCHANVDAGPIDLLPKVAARPQVRCRRCGHTTKLSLPVAVASSVAGVVLGVALMAVCYWPITDSVLGESLGPAAMLFTLPIGMAAWTLGYIAFAASCYGLQRLWILGRGTD